MFNVHNPHEIVMKLLTRLLVGPSHLCEQKFRHNFEEFLEPFCNCGLYIGTTTLFFYNSG